MFGKKNVALEFRLRNNLGFQNDKDLVSCENKQGVKNASSSVINFVLETQKCLVPLQFQIQRLIVFKER